MSKLALIDHFVVLMLENRSFDNIFGTLYKKSSAFDGVDGTETNPDRSGKPVRLEASPDDKLTLEDLSRPSPDPGECFSDINMQIFGEGQIGTLPHNFPKPGAKPNMSGFVQSYTDINVCDDDPSRGDYKPEQIMSYYTAKHLPAMTTLAKAFAVSDRWFASAPCQTWPNRFFVHAGTACGYENNDVFARLLHPDYSQIKTVFDLLEATNPPTPFAIYHHDVPLSLALPRMTSHYHDRFRQFENFAADVAAGKLPSYAFIEPRYYAEPGGPFPWIRLANDQHPPHVVTFGDNLVASVYKALRANEAVWKKTMLIVIYDEHGGCYDHVPPGPATPPRPGPAQNPSPVFAFDRYGVRVPAIIASPYIREGTVLRPTDADGQPSEWPFDHTSVIATLRARFGLGPLTPRPAGAPMSRDEVAPTLECALSLDAPANLGPGELPVSEFDPGIAYKLHALTEKLDDIRQSIHDFARHLAHKDPNVKNLPPDLQADINSHVTLSDSKAPDGVNSNLGAYWAHLWRAPLRLFGL